MAYASLSANTSLYSTPEAGPPNTFTSNGSPPQRRKMPLGPPHTLLTPTPLASLREGSPISQLPLPAPGVSEVGKFVLPTRLSRLTRGRRRQFIYVFLGCCFITAVMMLRDTSKLGLICEKKEKPPDLREGLSAFGSGMYNGDGWSSRIVPGFSHSASLPSADPVPDNEENYRNALFSFLPYWKSKLKFPLLSHLPTLSGRLPVMLGKPHPIPQLMERAKERWEELKSKQSKTLEEAVNEYRKRYRRDPPRGFDKWYEFAIANDFLLIDEFDLLERQFFPFRAFSGQSFRDRTKSIEENLPDRFMWSVQVDSIPASSSSPSGGFGGMDKKDFGIERLKKKIKGMQRRQQNGRGGGNEMNDNDDGNGGNEWKTVVRLGGQLEDHPRAKAVKTLIEADGWADRFQWPEGMKLWYSGHDREQLYLGWEERQRLSQLVSDRQYDTEEPPFNDPEKYRPINENDALGLTCPPDSLLRLQGHPTISEMKNYTGTEMPWDIGLESKWGEENVEYVAGNVVEEVGLGTGGGYLDICENPQYAPFHSSTTYNYPMRPGPLYPLLSPGVHGHFPDILSVLLEQFSESDDVIPWEEKTENKAVWRGQTSGPLWSSRNPWKTSHRSRIHLIGNLDTGSRNIFLPSPEPTQEPSLIDQIYSRFFRSAPAKDTVYLTNATNKELNREFLDVGMVGPAVQCVKADGTCDEMEKLYGGYKERMGRDDQYRFKYALDIDGNSWSGRFRRLMVSNSAVLKATVFPEFWSDWAIPWLHYIPIQVDYSDLYSVLGFFRGDLDGKGGHDDLAKQIADAGKEWGERCWRYEDIQVVQYRMMLEYARLWEDDRDAASYRPAS